MTAKPNAPQVGTPQHQPATPIKASTRYVRLRELQTMVPFSVPTIWRKTRDGSFPPAIKLSTRITAWNREAVEQWLSQKERA